MNNEHLNKAAAGQAAGAGLQASRPTINQQIESLFDIASRTESAIQRLEAGVDALLGAEPNEACSTADKAHEPINICETIGANIRYHETNARRLERLVDRFREYTG